MAHTDQVHESVTTMVAAVSEKACNESYGANTDSVVLPTL